MKQDASLHIRAAKGHEDAANRHLERYENQMRAAGAQLYEAFKMVMTAAGKPPILGQKWRRWYNTAPRAAWDLELAKENLDRAWANDVMRWHVDLGDARGRLNAMGTRRAPVKPRQAKR